MKRELEDYQVFIRIALIRIIERRRIAVARASREERNRARRNTSSYSQVRVRYGIFTDFLPIGINIPVTGLLFPGASVSEVEKYIEGHLEFLEPRVRQGYLHAEAQPGAEQKLRNGIDPERQKRVIKDYCSECLAVVREAHQRWCSLLGIYFENFLVPDEQKFRLYEDLTSLIEEQFHHLSRWSPDFEKLMETHRFPFFNDIRKIGAKHPVYVKWDDYSLRATGFQDKLNKLWMAAGSPVIISQSKIKRIGNADRVLALYRKTREQLSSSKAERSGEVVADKAMQKAEGKVQSDAAVALISVPGNPVLEISRGESKFRYGSGEWRHRGARGKILAALMRAPQYETFSGKILRNGRRYTISELARDVFSECIDRAVRDAIQDIRRNLKTHISEENKKRNIEASYIPCEIRTIDKGFMLVIRKSAN